MSFTHDSIIILSYRRKWIFVNNYKWQIDQESIALQRIFIACFHLFLFLRSIALSHTDESEGKAMECIIIRLTKMFSIDRNDVASSNVLSNDVYAWIFYRKRCRKIEARFHILVDDAVATTLSIYTSFHICRRQIV